MPAEAGRPPNPLTWRQVVVVQLILVLLGGMVLDGGYLLRVAAGGAIVSWAGGVAVTVARRRRAVLPVMFGSWLLGALVVGAVLHGRPLLRVNTRLDANANTVRQLALSCQAYAAEDHVGSWPADLSALVAWSAGEVDQRMLLARGQAEERHPVLYVRPAVPAAPYQPVLIVDPACDRTGRLVVCCADGRSQVVDDAGRAAALWAEARRLAAMPGAHAAGEWQVGLGP